ncbi:innexin unc-9-like [Pecten maximus]|uniref:innexin unc-9-like n=1 Tax=Pecten maximus TaxID=6579 RepID=UPI0014591100|nr:innexin unc-9-like [Pecten maximus]
MGTYEDACTAIDREKSNRENNNIGEFFIQHLNSGYCSFLFVLTAIVVVAKDVFGEKIKCWCPATFTDKQVDYTNNYCYIRNTYYVSPGRTIPRYGEDRQEYEITYYPWVPVILLSQCVLFVIPKWTWMELQTCASFSFISRLTKSQSSLSTDEQSKIAHIMHRWIQIRVLKKKPGIRVQRNTHSFELSRESYLAKAYAICCLLYVMNSLGQMYLLDRVLGNKFLTLGTDVLFQNNPEENGPGMVRFPTVTFCDADIRRMTNVKTYTVQCSLPNNLFNEQIFLWVWFLLVFLSIINFLSLLDNFTIFIRGRRRVLIRRLLVFGENQTNSSQDVGNDRKLFDEFLDHYLGVDGVFVISVIRYQLGAVYTSVLVENLWNIFNDHKNNDEKTN